MKKILLFIMLLNMSVFAQTNSYHEFPDSQAVWNVSYQEWGMGSCGEYSYTIGEDTLINGLVYSKVIQTGHDFSMTFVNDWSPHWECDHSIMYSNYSDYRAGIREDLAQKKVFIVDKYESQESLLYDFTLEAGDTIKGYLSYGPMTVGLVDSVMINTTYRKRWHINAAIPNAYEIIEGIGSSRGMLNAYNDFEYYSNLDCFSENGSSLYPSNTGSCGLLTSIDQITSPSEIFQVFPNPSSGIFKIKAELNASIKVCNILGEEILNVKLISDPALIDLSGYPDGVYFITLQNKTSATQKIIKTNNQL
ncbi:MAG: hypothetical protein K0Q95_1901 [Bacteroidota bacterium]|jgi:hypothetical protein|nr:hypothetical protein [Bacteroidota bacterium]